MSKKSTPDDIDAQPKRRGRPPKQKTIEGAIEQSKAAESNLSPEARRALFVNGLMKLERLREKLNAANADVRNQRKALKAGGFSKEEIDYALYLRRTDDADIREQAEARERVARYLAKPIGFQFALLDANRTPEVDRAFERGKTAGMQGESCVPPYAAGSPQGQRWIEGWHEGQASLMAAFRAKGDDPEHPAGYTADDAQGDASNDDGEDLRPPFLREKEAEPPAAAAE